MSKMSKKEARVRRHRRARRKIVGTSVVPRMSVCRTGKHVYVQIIDDTKQVTLASASTLETVFRESEKKTNVDGVRELGKIAAERTLAVSIKQVVFDRGGFCFHGRIKALADAAREAGLEF